MKTVAGTFKGFPREGIAFLRDLKENNDRDWFTPRLDEYKDSVRAPMLELVQAVHLAMLKFAPAYVGEPAKCLYRIYRDTRFSKDKTPYKTHAAAAFWRSNMEKNEGAGYYFAISPEEVAIGGGMYMPLPPVLLTTRQRIAADAEGFRETFDTKTVRRLLGELQGEQTKRVPKGFSAEHPAADLLRFKQYVLSTTLKPDVATSSKLVREIATKFEAMTPFVEFLDRPFAGKARRG